MINICTSCPIDFSDNALYVVSHVLHIEQWYSFVTIKLMEKALRVLVLCSQKAERALPFCWSVVVKFIHWNVKPELISVEGTMGTIT